MSQARRVKGTPFLAIVLVLVALLCSVQSSLATCTADTSNTLTLETRAVSLKILQAKLRSCSPTGSCPKELLELGGLKRVTGYVVHKENHDLILMGYADSGRPEAPLPPLHLEDFVVAMRSAWLKYAAVQSNTISYTPPGCSIDPQPTVLKKLQDIKQQIAQRVASG